VSILTNSRNSCRQLREITHHCKKITLFAVLSQGSKIIYNINSSVTMQTQVLELGILVCKKTGTSSPTAKEVLCVQPHAKTTKILGERYQSC